MPRQHPLGETWRENGQAYVRMRAVGPVQEGQPVRSVGTLVRFGVRGVSATWPRRPFGAATEAAADGAEFVVQTWPL